MSSRLNKLEEELGVLVFPKKEEIRRASVEEFLNHVGRVVAALETIDTTVWNAKTAIFILSLYMRPPSLAFVRATVKDMQGDVKVIISEKKYTITFDEFYSIMGAVYYKKSYKPPRILINYIPVSYDYYVVTREISKNWVHKAVLKKMEWYVYKSRDPVIANISHILNMNI